MPALITIKALSYRPDTYGVYSTRDIVIDTAEKPSIQLVELISRERALELVNIWNRQAVLKAGTGVLFTWYYLVSFEVKP